jgi:hypothetical protein
MLSEMNPRQAVEAVLRREDPGRVVYAPNYWQWFAHHHHHGTLPVFLTQAVPFLASRAAFLRGTRGLGLIEWRILFVLRSIR